MSLSPDDLTTGLALDDDTFRAFERFRELVLLQSGRLNEGFERVVDAVNDISRQVEFLERDLGATQSTVHTLARGGRVDTTPEMISVADQPWNCSGCGNRLGLYDPQSDVIRIKHKDWYGQFHAGAGGWLEVSCLKCGRTQRVDDEPG